VFGLPRSLVDAMTIFTDPRPLHWGNAIATLANIRVDEAPGVNVASIATALRLMNAAYATYAAERAAYLRQHPDAPGAGEAGLLASVRSVAPEDVIPLFNYCVARASLDRPVLTTVLARAWLVQVGGSAVFAGGEVTGAMLAEAAAEGREEEEGEGQRQWVLEAFALGAFKAATEWAAAVTLS
jgi:hypothetical protein